jgi:diacylglycerol kinase family enzyme
VQPSSYSDFVTRHAAALGRAAAVVALVALAVLTVGSVSVLLKHFGDLLIAFVFLLFTVFGGWFVLTRRTVMRVVGSVIFALGLIALIAQLGVYGLFLLSVLAGLLTVFGMTARYAVRDHRTLLHRTQQDRRCAEPARKGVLIINPHSGGGKAQQFNLVEEARRRNVEPVILGSADDLHALATKAAAEGADVIGMAGGDGSQAVVATVAMECDVAHVCVPAGTRNHFALDLGLDRNDVIGALDAFRDGVERRIDLARVNDRVFVNNASIGVYARVVQSESYRNGKLRTWRRMLPDMLGRGAGACTMQFDTPDAKDWCDAAFVIVSNNPYQLRRFGGLGTRPRLDTGVLGIFATRIHNARALAKLVSLGTFGLHRRFGGMLQWATPAFEVRSSGLIAVGLDGEALMLQPPLQFTSLRGALRVRIPREAASVSPAAAAVAFRRSDLGALVRIAAGRHDPASSQR